MGGWIDGWWMGGQMHDKRVDGWVDRWMDGWVGGWGMDGWVNVWIVGWMNGWLNVWVGDTLPSRNLQLLWSRGWQTLIQKPNLPPTPPFFVNKVLLKHSHPQSCTYHLWLLLYYNKTESLQQRPYTGPLHGMWPVQAHEALHLEGPHVTIFIIHVTVFFYEYISLFIKFIYF